jgi:hypothetical protein
LGAFAKLATSFMMSARSFVGMKQLGSPLTDFHEI